jgi:hypothetical protein
MQGLYYERGYLQIRKTLYRERVRLHARLRKSKKYKRIKTMAITRLTPAQQLVYSAKAGDMRGLEKAINDLKLDYPNMNWSKSDRDAVANAWNEAVPANKTAVIDRLLPYTGYLMHVSSTNNRLDYKWYPSFFETVNNSSVDVIKKVCEKLIQCEQNEAKQQSWAHQVYVVSAYNQMFNILLIGAVNRNDISLLKFLLISKKIFHREGNIDLGAIHDLYNTTENDDIRDYLNLIYALRKCLTEGGAFYFENLIKQFNQLQEHQLANALDPAKCIADNFKWSDCELSKIKNEPIKIYIKVLMEQGGYDRELECFKLAEVNAKKIDEEIKQAKDHWFIPRPYGADEVKTYYTNATQKFDTRFKTLTGLIEGLDPVKHAEIIDPRLKDIIEKLRNYIKSPIYLEKFERHEKQYKCDAIDAKFTKYQQLTKLLNNEKQTSAEAQKQAVAEALPLYRELSNSALFSGMLPDHKEIKATLAAEAREKLAPASAPPLETATVAALIPAPIKQEPVVAPSAPAAPPGGIVAAEAAPAKAEGKSVPVTVFFASATDEGVPNTPAKQAQNAVLLDYLINRIAEARRVLEDHIVEANATLNIMKHEGTPIPEDRERYLQSMIRYSQRAQLLFNAPTLAVVDNPEASPATFGVKQTR